MRRAAEIPTCPHCGAPQHRVIVGPWLFPNDKQDVENGRAIFAGMAIWPRRAKQEIPNFVCLTCVPQWAEVNRLASLDMEWQIAKEDAVGAGDFHAAAAFRDKQYGIRGPLKTLVTNLVSEDQ